MTELHLRILEKGEIECRDVTALLGGYVDGDLGITLRERLDQHIACCDKCESGLQTYKQVVELAATLRVDPVPLPSEIQLRLRRALNERLGLNL